MLWILDEDGRTPIHLSIDEYDRWSEWMNTHDRVIKQTTVGTTFISTVFLGIAAPIMGTGEYGCFETWFAEDGDGPPLYLRDRTYADAEHTHAMAVAAVLRPGD
jgi:hypothetical protein